MRSHLHVAAVGKLGHMHSRLRGPGRHAGVEPGRGRIRRRVPDAETIPGAAHASHHEPVSLNVAPQKNEDATYKTVGP